MRYSNILNLSDNGVLSFKVDFRAVFQKRISQRLKPKVKHNKIKKIKQLFHSNICLEK